MKKYLIITSLALGSLTYSSEPPVDITSGNISSNHVTTDSVNYLSGGIPIAYQFGSEITAPPIINITPVYTGVENTTTGIIASSAELGSFDVGGT